MMISRRYRQIEHINFCNELRRGFVYPHTIAYLVRLVEHDAELRRILAAGPARENPQGSAAHGSVAALVAA
jgi:hypothetical protein